MVDQAPPAAQKPTLLRTSAWVLYDLANTVYAATLTFLFTPFCLERFGNTKSVGITQTASMVLAGALVPILGALVDRTCRTRGYLAVGTLACIAGMAGWTLEAGQGWFLACFFVANLGYNVSLLFYNTLLPAAASPERTGLVSGIGTGLGYFGTILVLVALLGGEPHGAFGRAAAVFLVGALPCLLLVRDPRTPQPAGTGGAVRPALQSLGRTVRDLPRHRALLFFLLGNFCLVDVLNTAILYFAAFTQGVFADQAARGELVLLGHSFSGPGATLEFVRIAGLGLNGLALVFGIGLGFLADRRPLAVMRASAVALLVALCGGAFFGGRSALGYLLTLVLLGSFGLSGIWTAGRKVIVLLAPKDRVGEFFGFYGITVKLSVIGSSVYGLVADFAGTLTIGSDGRSSLVPDHKAAMVAQSVQLVLGLGFMALVRLPRRTAEQP